MSTSVHTGAWCGQEVNTAHTILLERSHLCKALLCWKRLAAGTRAAGTKPGEEWARDVLILVLLASLLSSVPTLAGPGWPWVGGWD